MKSVCIFVVYCGMVISAFAQGPAGPQGGGQQGPQPSAQDPVKEFVQQGRKLNSEGKYLEALRVYERALELDPNNFDAQVAMGSTLDLVGRYGEARRHFSKAIQVAKPDEGVQAQRAMAISWAFERKPGEAAKYEEPIFNERLAKNDYTGAAEIANELARLYLESGDLDNAYIWYKRGYDTAIRKTEQTPQQLALWQFRWEHAQARIAARRNQKEEAQKHVAAAKVALDKTGDKDQQTFYPYLTGYVAYYLGEYKTAVTDFEQANQRDPFILAMLAQSYEKLGEKQKAEDLYKKIMTISAHNPTGAYARPLARQKLGL